MRYEILGPLRIIDEHAVPSSPSARKLKILLAALVIRAGQLVTAEQLMAEMWGEHLPRSAAASLHVHVSQLRKFLRRQGREESIVTRSPGYQLSIGTDELDLDEFLALTRQGRQDVAAARLKSAAECFDAALRLWRGPTLSEVRDGPIIGGFATWLEEVRLECVELLVDAELSLGQHQQAIGQLYSLTAQYPLRERLRQQLMLALYRSDRRADALAVYRDARNTLREQLGLEPGRALCWLQQAIIDADARLDSFEPQAIDAAGAHPRPVGPVGRSVLAGRTGQDTGAVFCDSRLLIA